MKKKTHPVKNTKSTEIETEFPGYPLYPASEDIYNNEEKVELPESEETPVSKKTEDGEWNEKGLEEDLTGDDLDVPGSELDDENEETGNEDEENNYYSLGGDNHDD
jgi:hypothetical protein